MNQEAVNKQLPIPALQKRQSGWSRASGHSVAVLRHMKPRVGRFLIWAARIWPRLRPVLCSTGLRVTWPYFGSRPAQIPTNTSPLILSHISDNYLSFQLFWKGLNYYEPLTRTAVEELAQLHALFLDVGANVGFFSLVAAKQNPLLRIVSFEPNPKMVQILTANAALNCGSQVTIEGAALSNQDGVASLFLSSSDMSASLVHDFQSFNPAIASVPVETMRLDSYCSKIAPDLLTSMFLKVDVEGAESDFFAGARTTLSTFHPDIIVEVLDRFDEGLTEWLRACGYSFFQICPEGLRKVSCIAPCTQGKLHFLNYLFSAKGTDRLSKISRKVRIMAQQIDLSKTSKCFGTTRGSRPNRQD